MCEIAAKSQQPIHGPAGVSGENRGALLPDNPNALGAKHEGSGGFSIFSPRRIRRRRWGQRRTALLLFIYRCCAYVVHSALF